MKKNIALNNWNSKLVQLAVMKWLTKMKLVMRNNYYNYNNNKRHIFIIEWLMFDLFKLYVCLCKYCNEWYYERKLLLNESNWLI